MRSWRWLFLLSLCRQICSQQIHLISPLHDSTFMTIPPSTTATVPLKFQVLSEEPLTQDLLVCIDLYSSGDLVFKNQCVPYTNNNLNLQFVPAGPASVSLSLKKGGQILPDSTTSLPFRIVTMESALPLLIGPPNLQFLANPNTDSSDASIEFFLSDIALTSYLVVCLEVTPISDTSFRVKRTCVPPDQNHLSLYNLPAGSYQLSLEFQQANTPFTQFPSSRKVSSIVISRLEDLLPSIFVDNPILEYGISPESEHVSEVLLNVASTAHPKYPNTDMISHTDICLSLIPGANSTLEEMSNCVPNKVFLQFTLRQIPRGTHSYSLTLRSHHNPSIIFEKSKLSGRIVVQDMEEFIPSYDWTALKPWHTIPSGLETRYLVPNSLL